MLVFCAPLVFAFLRKIHPEQSAIVEAFAYPCFFLLAFYSFAFDRRPSRESDPGIRFAIFTLLSCYVTSWCLGFFNGGKFFFAVFLSRILPLSLIFVARKPLDLDYVLTRVVSVYTIGACIMLPFGLLAFLGGDLPGLFSPGIGMEASGKGRRFGLPVYYGFFYSNVVLSWTYWAVGVLCLFMVEKQVARGLKIKKVYLVGFALALILLVLASKRLPIIALVLALVLTSVRMGVITKTLRQLFSLVFLATIVGGLFYIINLKSGFYVLDSISNSFQQVTDGYFLSILNEVFLPRVLYYGDTIIGAGLGAAGPEARYFVPMLWLSHYMVPEMGIVMWLIEMGVFLTLIALSSLLLLEFRLFRLFLTSDRQLYLFMCIFFTAFAFKELNIMVGPYFHISVLWFAVGYMSVAANRKALY